MRVLPKYVRKYYTQSLKTSLTRTEYINYNQESIYATLYLYAVIEIKDP